MGREKIVTIAASSLGYGARGMSSTGRTEIPVSGRVLDVS
jgi:hypothetical protein